MLYSHPCSLQKTSTKNCFKASSWMASMVRCHECVTVSLYKYGRGFPYTWNAVLEGNSQELTVANLSSDVNTRECLWTSCSSFVLSETTAIQGVQVISITTSKNRHIWRSLCLWKVLSTDYSVDKRFLDTVAEHNAMPRTNRRRTVTSDSGERWQAGMKTNRSNGGPGGRNSWTQWLSPLRSQGSSKPSSNPVPSDFLW
jgi:hypothetical protein